MTEWRRLSLPFSGETMIIAVSGGADSTALVFALDELKQRKKLNLRFVIAHLNHKLRGEQSRSDERFVRQIAEKLKIELVLSAGKIFSEGNLEQNAREKRYDFLTETAENLQAHAVLTAHTMNDQAETFLMNLIRGSGIKGLGGIKPIRSLDGEMLRLKDKKIKAQPESDNDPSRRLLISRSILLVRPLLNWAKRADTENFCHQNGIEFRLDAMNEDLRFQRVRVRKVLLPLLGDFNPKIVENLARTAELLRGEIERDLEPQSLIAEETLALKDLNGLPKPQLYRTLRAWLEYKRGDLRRLELQHIEAIERLAFSRKSGKTVELPGGEKVIKNKGKLYFQKRKVEKSEE